ncbi:MAG: hypothetical protein JW768_08840 [Chitinispirillaceae bacterium]|nr:hypothetical protein [Chitinispirillaceae bacterium]
MVGNVLFKRQTGANNDPNFSVTRIGGDATGESHGRYRFVNNTVVCGSGAVFRMFDSLESVEMHNNAFYRGSGGVNVMRTVEARWTTGEPRIAGSGNWIVTGSTNIPQGWSDTKTGSAPGFVNLSSNDLRPEQSSPLRDSGTASPVRGDTLTLLRPLFPPAFHPPQGQAILPGNATVRPVDARIDIGAFEYAAQGLIDYPQKHGNGDFAILAAACRSGVVTVRCRIPNACEVVVRLADIQGRIVASHKQTVPAPGRHSLRIDLRRMNVAQGICAVAVKTPSSAACCCAIASCSMP